jgi:beta-lactam-binding protein with PASTA domain
MKKYVARFAVIAALAALAIGMAAVSASAYHVPANKCVVPVLVGKTTAQARTALSKSHCALGTVTKAKQTGSGKKVGKGKIWKNSPAAGTQHKVGTKVNVTEAK